MSNRLLTPIEQKLILAVMAALVFGVGSLLYHYHVAKPAAPSIQPVSAVAPSSVPPPMESPAAATPAPVPVPEPAPSKPVEAVAQVVVSVVGAVNRPGLVHVFRDARVQDAITAAGGASDAADLSDLNLAAILIDGSTLTVPERASAQRDGERITVRGGASASDLNPPQYTISGWSTPGAVAAGASPEGAAHDTPKSEALPKAGASAKSGPLDLNTATVEELDTLPGIGPKLAAEIVAYRTRTPFTAVDDLTNVPGIGERKLDAIRRLITVQGSAVAPAAPESEEPAKPKRKTSRKAATSEQK